MGHDYDLIGGCGDGLNRDYLGIDEGAMDDRVDGRRESLLHAVEVGVTYRDRTSRDYA
jgi:hypothetical protein